MKKCIKCLQNKLLEQFHKNKNRKDGLQDYCKLCCKIRDHNSYIKKGKKYWDINTEKIIKRNKIFIIKFLSIFGKCKDCGNRDIRVLEFDHLQSKKHNISDLIIHGYSIKNIKEEIRKCEIRCCNCHRIKTSKDRNFWKTKL